MTLQTAKLRLVLCHPVDENLTDGEKLLSVDSVASVVTEGPITPLKATMDHGRNEIDIFEWYNINRSVTLEMETHATAYRHEWNYDAEDIGNIGDIDFYTYERYLEPAWEMDKVGDPYNLYDPYDLEVSTRAKELKGSTQNVRDITYNFLEWIAEEIEFSSISEMDMDQITYGGWSKPPYQTLADGHGTADDITFLFASMCRSVGIPAWMEFGYIIREGGNDIEGGSWPVFVLPVRTQSGFEMVEVRSTPHEAPYLKFPPALIEWADTGDNIIFKGESCYNLEFALTYIETTKPRVVEVEVDLRTESISFRENGPWERFTGFENTNVDPDPDGDPPYAFIVVCGISIMVILVAASVLVYLLINWRSKQKEIVQDVPVRKPEPEIVSKPPDREPPPDPFHRDMDAAITLRSPDQGVKGGKL